MKNKKNKSKDKLNFNIIKGSIFSITISLILLLIVAILLTYTDISEQIIPIAIMIISSLSIFTGSLVSTIKKNKGLMNGFCVGTIYIMSMYLISSFIISDFSINMKSVIMIILSVTFGMIGGIVGVNISKR